MIMSKQEFERTIKKLITDLSDTVTINKKNWEIETFVNIESAVQIFLAITYPACTSWRK